MAKKNPCKRRILLKLSGEALSKDGSRGVDPKALNDIAKEIAHLHKSTGCQLAIVIGGGNIWRGLRDGGGVIDRVNSDSMGMLATVINAIALQSAIEEAGVPTRVLTSINIYQLAEPFVRRKALRHRYHGFVQNPVGSRSSILGLAPAEKPCTISQTAPHPNP